MHLDDLTAIRPVADLDLAHQVAVAVPEEVDLDTAFTGGYALVTTEATARGISTGVGYRYLVAQVTDCDDKEAQAPTRHLTLTVHATAYDYTLAPLHAKLELPSHHQVRVVRGSDFL